MYLDSVKITVLSYANSPHRDYAHEYRDTVVNSKMGREMGMGTGRNIWLIHFILKTSMWNSSVFTTCMRCYLCFCYLLLCWVMLFHQLTDEPIVAFFFIEKDLARMLFRFGDGDCVSQANTLSAMLLPFQSFHNWVIHWAHKLA